MIVIIKPNINFLTVNFIVPFCTPLKTKIDINNKSNIIGVSTISPLFLYQLKHPLVEEGGLLGFRVKSIIKYSVFYYNKIIMFLIFYTTLTSIIIRVMV